MDLAFRGDIWRPEGKARGPSSQKEGRKLIVCPKCCLQFDGAAFSAVTLHFSEALTPNVP